MSEQTIELLVDIGTAFALVAGAFGFGFGLAYRLTMKKWRELETRVQAIEASRTQGSDIYDKDGRLRDYR